MNDTFPVKIRRSVWIVQDAESLQNAILGVFPSIKEAVAFAEEVKGQFEKGVLTEQIRHWLLIRRQQRSSRCPRRNLELTRCP
jgi:hypothetical protein